MILKQGEEKHSLVSKDVVDSTFTENTALLQVMGVYTLLGTVNEKTIYLVRGVSCEESYILGSSPITIRREPWNFLWELLMCSHGCNSTVATHWSCILGKH